MISAFPNARFFRYIVMPRSAAIVRFALFSQRRRSNSLALRPSSIFLSVWFFSFCACSAVISPLCKDQYRLRRNEYISVSCSVRLSGIGSFCWACFSNQYVTLSSFTSPQFPGSSPVGSPQKPSVFNGFPAFPAVFAFSYTREEY